MVVNSFVYWHLLFISIPPLRISSPSNDTFSLKFQPGTMTLGSLSFQTDPMTLVSLTIQPDTMTFESHESHPHTIHLLISHIFPVQTHLVASHFNHIKWHLRVSHFNLLQWHLKVMNFNLLQLHLLFSHVTCYNDTWYSLIPSWPWSYPGIYLHPARSAVLRLRALDVASAVHLLPGEPACGVLGHQGGGQACVLYNWAKRQEAKRHEEVDVQDYRWARHGGLQQCQ